jgi:hypothetical protein
MEKFAHHIEIYWYDSKISTGTLKNIQSYLGLLSSVNESNYHPEHITHLKTVNHFLEDALKISINGTIGSEWSY